jgi:hypothetical protein
MFVVACDQVIDVGAFTGNMLADYLYGFEVISFTTFVLLCVRYSILVLIFFRRCVMLLGLFQFIYFDKANFSGNSEIANREIDNLKFFYLKY